jgi:hypothetical protein
VWLRFCSRVLFSLLSLSSFVPSLTLSSQTILNTLEGSLNEQSKPLLLSLAVIGNSCPEFFDDANVCLQACRALERSGKIDSVPVRRLWKCLSQLLFLTHPPAHPNTHLHRSRR